MVLTKTGIFLIGISRLCGYSMAMEHLHRVKAVRVYSVIISLMSPMAYTSGQQ